MFLPQNALIEPILKDQNLKYQYNQIQHRYKYQPEELGVDVFNRVSARFQF